MVDISEQFYMINHKIKTKCLYFGMKTKEWEHEHNKMDITYFDARLYIYSIYIYWFDFW